MAISCTEDTRWTFLGDSTLDGKEAVRQWTSDTYREPAFTVHRMIAEGDFVAAIEEITLKDEDGKTTHNSYCDVWRFQDGSASRTASLRRRHRSGALIHPGDAADERLKILSACERVPPAGDLTPRRAALDGNVPASGHRLWAGLLEGW